MFHSKLSNHKRLSRLAMTEWSFSRLFHQVWILLCRHLIRRSQQFKFRAPTQKLLVQFVHMYNCHLLSWISSLRSNTYFRHLDLISPNLRIFRCEITLTRALDFMRLGFRFIAPFGRKLIEAQMGQKWCKCQAPNYGNYQVIFEFTMFVFWVPNFDRFPLMIREKTAHISWWKSRVVIPRMLATRRVRRFCECCVAPSVGCWCMRLLGCR